MKLPLMRLQVLPRLAVFLSGVLVLAIGLAHFVMPVLGYDGRDLEAIPEAQREHFVYLGTYAIGLFLVCFALLTLHAGIRGPEGQSAVFLGLMSLVWGGRLVLEFLYPVSLPLFFLTHPHPVLAAVILAIWSGYVLGFAASMKGALKQDGTT